MKVHVPCARDAARWLALATVAQQIARGESFAWHELEWLADLTVKCVVFGENVPTNPCNMLLQVAYSLTASTSPGLYHEALGRHGEAVVKLFNAWWAASSSEVGV